MLLLPSGITTDQLFPFRKSTSRVTRSLMELLMPASVTMS